MRGQSFVVGVLNLFAPGFDRGLHLVGGKTERANLLGQEVVYL
jgi:hypothetical protein